jgi:quercetin 2,3-dioxygenase
MITLLRSDERRHVRGEDHDIWMTSFIETHEGSRTTAFGALVALDEIWLAPGKGTAPRPGDEREIVTYLYKGALAQEDSTGGSGVIQAGEFQRMYTGRKVRRKETNASRVDWAHAFRISLLPSEIGLEICQEQQRFAAAQRRNALCVVASADGRKGSLRLRQDAVICSSILDAGHHLVHELKPGHSAWLHVVCGAATLQDVVLIQGDGAGVAAEPSVSLTVREGTEILLLDLGPAPSRERRGE